MRKFFTLLFVLLTLVLPLQAQDVDDTFVFVDAEENVFENEATIIRNEVLSGESGDTIKADVYVLNCWGEDNDYIIMHYTINHIDNGSYQICFPASCNYQNQAGSYVTSPGQLMEEMQDIMSEWFPITDGICDVSLMIEVVTRKAGFPPTYEHKAYGPSLNIKFVKGEIPGPVIGDVNGDGEVNISDVNAVINAVLSGSGNTDVNDDGEVNLSDVNYIIGIILNQ